MVSDILWQTSAKIVVAGVLPHGDFAFDPSVVHNADGSAALHGNATLLATRIAASKPDIVFLSSRPGVHNRVHTLPQHKLEVIKYVCAVLHLCLRS